MSVAEQIQGAMEQVLSGDGTAVVEEVDYIPASGAAVAGINALVNRLGVDRETSFQADSDEETADFEVLSSDVSEARIGDQVDTAADSGGRWRVVSVLQGVPGAIRFRAARRVQAVRRI